MGYQEGFIKSNSIEYMNELVNVIKEQKYCDMLIRFSKVKIKKDIGVFEKGSETIMFYGERMKNINEIFESTNLMISNINNFDTIAIEEQPYYEIFTQGIVDEYFDIDQDFFTTID